MEDAAGGKCTLVFCPEMIDMLEIDFMLGSWIHCQLPSGGAFNITTLFTYLNSSTDAPNFVIELIRSSPTSLVLLDLPPPKDLALHPDYLQTFYEDAQLESRRQLLEKIPEVHPYFSSSLYIRCVFSPTAILNRIETGAGGVERMEEILRAHVGPVPKEVLGIWLDQCCIWRERSRRFLESLLRKKGCNDQKQNNRD